MTNNNNNNNDEQQSNNDPIVMNENSNENKIIKNEKEIDSIYKIVNESTARQSKPPPWHNNNNNNDDDKVSFLQGSFWNDCFAKANQKRIQSMEKQRHDQDIPQFTSLLLSKRRRNNDNDNDEYAWMAIFSTLHIVWKYRPNHLQKIRRWTNENFNSTTNTTWYCNQQRATIVNNGCPDGTTFVIRCPQLVRRYNQNNKTLQEEDEVINKIIVKSPPEIPKMTFRVYDYWKCTLQQPLVKPQQQQQVIKKSESENNHPPSPRIAATAYLFGQITRRIYEILPWIEYHRLAIGISHFYLYLVADYDDNKDWNLLPSLPYITWIPWNMMNTTQLSLRHRAKFLSFQIAQQVDAIHRARADGIDWLTLNDLDEYLQIMSNDNNKINRKFIQQFENKAIRQQKTPLGCIMGKTINFGKHFNDTKNDFITMTPRRNEQQPPMLPLEYTWRATRAYSDMRQKCIVHTGRVDYYNNHYIPTRRRQRKRSRSNNNDTEAWTVVANEWRELRFVHYKRASSGVFLQYIDNKTLIWDSSLRDQHLDTVRKRVDVIQQAMIDQTNGGYLRPEWKEGFQHLHHYRRR